MNIKSNVILLIFQLTFSIPFCNAQWQWSKSFGSTNDDRGGVNCYGDKIYISGEVHNRLFIDNDTLQPLGINDLFIAQYNLSGNQRNWIRQFGGTNSQPRFEHIQQVIPDENGVYVYGIYNQYPGNILYIDSVSASGKGGLDIFLARFNNNGICQWVKAFGSAGDDEPFSFAKDEFHNLYLLYETPYSDTINTVSYGPGVVIVKTDSSGNFISLRDSCVQNARPSSLSIYNNSIYIVGYGGGANIIVFDDTLSSSSPGFSSFIVKSDTGFHSVWSKRFGGGTSYDLAVFTGIDSEENVYLTGRFAGIVSIDNVADTCTAITDMYLIKFNNMGICQWLRKSNASDGATSFGILVEDSIVTIAGYFSGSATFGTSNISTINQSDFFVAAYTLDGDFLGVNHFGYASGGRIEKAGNNLLTSGLFRNTIQIGNTTHQSRGGKDIFVAMMDKITLVVDPARRQGLMIYANPSSGTFNIELPDGFDLTNAFLTVHDITGKEISKFPLNPDSEMRFEVLGATKGEYIVRLTNPQGMVSGKLIVQ